MRRPLALLSLLLLAGCSRGFKSDALGVQYEPPNGFSFQREDASGAHFDPGLTLRSVKGPLPQVAGGDAAARAQAIARAAGLDDPGRLLSSRAGSIPAGAVQRFGFEQGSNRTLLYVLPLSDRFLAITFTAPESRYGTLESRVELSLSTLRVR